jgi:hypothetical protein
MNKGLDPSEEDVADFMGMGKPLGRFMDRYSISALLRKLKKKKG